MREIIKPLILSLSSSVLDFIWPLSVDGLLSSLPHVEGLVLNGGEIHAHEEHTGTDLNKYKKTFGVLCVRNPENGPSGASVGVVTSAQLSYSGYYVQFWYDATGNVFGRVISKEKIPTWKNIFALTV